MPFKKSDHRHSNISSIDNSDDLFFLKKLSEEKEIKNMADEQRQELTYLDILNKARESENEAIAIGLKAITLAPPEDVQRLCEITQDENEHLSIYSEILKRYQQRGDDDD